MAKLLSARFSDLTIEDEDSFSHIGLYEALRRVVAASDHPFLVLRNQVKRASWDRALFLNLTFWHAAEASEVLVDEHLAADVVAHIAWHQLAAKQLAGKGPALSAEALLLSEAIASAFDLYLVGRLLGHRPDAEFLETQVPAMADAAEGAGMGEDDFEAMLQTVADDPERAFEDLRALLFDATTALYRCQGSGAATSVLEGLEGRRFVELLHHYELSNWVLYAHAYGGEKMVDEGARSVDAALRAAPVALDWLEENWLRPSLVGDSPTRARRRGDPR